jgi:hypothetical protein
LRNAGLAHKQSQRYLSIVNVFANGPLCDLAFGQLALHPRPDAVRGVPLFPRRSSVSFQNRVHKLDRRLQLPSRTLRLLPRPGQRAPDRLAHHPPVYTQLLSHPDNRPDSELVLPADLLK